MRRWRSLQEPEPDGAQRTGRTVAAVVFTALALIAVGAAIAATASAIVIAGAVFVALWQVINP